MEWDAGRLSNDESKKMVQSSAAFSWFVIFFLVGFLDMITMSPGQLSLRHRIIVMCHWRICKSTIVVGLHTSLTNA